MDYNEVQLQSVFSPQRAEHGFSCPVLQLNNGWTPC